jgi:phosphohistidine phosphatase
MKIYVLRHGAAEDGRPGSSDPERSLTDDGREALRGVLLRARNAEVSPSLILASPYVRAVQTAEMAAEILGSHQKVTVTKTLTPDGSPAEVWDEIRARRNEQQILLAGHEPLLSQVVAYLLGAPALLVDMKKAALVCVEMGAFGQEPRGVLEWMLTPRLAAS